MSDDPELRAATLGRLELLDGRLAEAVGAMQIASPGGHDPLRGLYISDEHAAILASRQRQSAAAESVLGPLDPVLRDWGLAVGLDDIDVDMLLVAAAPDIDRRYEQLYGYLHDDVTRRRATVGLALRLIGVDVTDPSARRRLAADSPLVSRGLVDLEESDRPFITRSLRVPDRAVMAMLGDRSPAPGVTIRADASIANDWVHRLSVVLARGTPLVHVRDRPDRTAAELAVAALVDVEGEAVVAQVASSTPPAKAVLSDAIREVVLRACGLVVDSVDGLVDDDPALVDRLASLPRPVVLVGTRPWDPDWSTCVPLLLDAPTFDPDERTRAWRSALGAACDVTELGAVVDTFRLGPDRIRRAASAAVLAAEYRGDAVSGDDLQRGARQQNGAGLQRLARRIEPSVGWDDLILEPEAFEAVREVAVRVRHRSFVMEQWRLRRGGGRGEGITALFAGPSGTGKTLAAEVIAGDLGVDLHTVDLATVVDKYIGETEKNLDRIFNEAEQVNTVLFFDEADALFGKRSEVKDARDRYANVEVAYLLQRMERFDGAAILATNLRLNIDEAFARRLDLVVDFPKPSIGERTRLWRVLTGPALPLARDVDLDLLASSFELCGGDIRNAVTTAAYLAAARDDEVTMTDLVRAVAREYRKLGRLCNESEFGVWFGAVSSDVA